MVNAHIAWTGFEPKPGKLCCVLGKNALILVSLFSQPCKMDTGEFMLGVALRWTNIPSSGGVEILLFTSSYRNRDKRLPDGSFGSYTDFTFALINLSPLGRRNPLPTSLWGHLCREQGLLTEKYHFGNAINSIAYNSAECSSLLVLSGWSRGILNRLSECARLFTVTQSAIQKEISIKSYQHW